MSDEELDLSWAKQQLGGARVPATVGKAILALLRVWGNFSFTNEEQQAQAVKLFAKLALAEAIVDETEVWTPVQVGFQVNVGDTVRVRANAFTGEAGQKHNGRVGRIIRKAGGDIIVRSTDGKEPYFDSTHYPPSALEVRPN